MKTILLALLVVASPGVVKTRADVGWQSTAGMRKVFLVIDGVSLDKEGLPEERLKKIIAERLKKHEIEVIAQSAWSQARETPVLRLQIQWHEANWDVHFSHAYVLQLSLHQDAALTRNKMAVPVAKTWASIADVYILSAAGQALVKSVSQETFSPDNLIKQGLGEVLGRFSSAYDKANARSGKPR